MSQNADYMRDVIEAAKRLQDRPADDERLASVSMSAFLALVRATAAFDTATNDSVPTHKMSWAEACAGVYLVRCVCGWSKMTYANSPVNSIGATYDAHIDSSGASNGS